MSYVKNAKGNLVCFQNEIPQFIVSYMKKVLRYSYYGYGGITIKQMLKFIGISSDDSYVLLMLHLKFSLYYISDNVSIIR